MRKVKLERAILEKSYISWADVERGWAEWARYFRRSIENMGAEIAAI